MDPSDPGFVELKRLRAEELVTRTGISQRQAMDLIDMLGLDRGVLLREAVILKKNWRII
jgi:hypothetical protein